MKFYQDSKWDSIESRGFESIGWPTIHQNNAPGYDPLYEHTAKAQQLPITRAKPQG